MSEKPSESVDSVPPSQVEAKPEPVRTNIKFKLAIKEISFEFEGDRELAGSIQSRFSQAIGGLNALPGVVLGSVPRAQVDGDTGGGTDVAPSKRRRRRVVNTSGLFSTDGAAQSHSGVPALIAKLITDGYFQQERTIGDIRSKLSERGFSLAANEISPTLVSFTRKDYLSRRKDTEANQYVYKKGNAEPSTSE